MRIPGMIPTDAIKAVPRFSNSKSGERAHLLRAVFAGFSDARKGRRGNIAMADCSRGQP
jgi:hypothetical protein